MTQFLDMFTPIQKGDFGLTDEAIYKSIQSGGNYIPVYGGSEEHRATRFVSEYGKTKYDQPITIFNDNGVVISLDGSSGCMTYLPKHRFALNHHAGFFKLPEEPKRMVMPEFFSLFYEKQLQEASVSEGSKTLNLKTIESIDFNIPDYDIQKEIMLRIKPILKTKEKVASLIMRINAIRGQWLSVNYQNYQVLDIPIRKVFDCFGGNSGLTEREIYHNIMCEGERYEVLSSSTNEDTKLGVIPVCHINGKPLEVFKDKEGILVIRNGKAGTTFFLEKGKYVITDHAYILAIHEDCKYEVSLKWFMNQYRQEFFEYISSADNATWNMTGFFDNTTISIPDYNEQLEVVKTFDYLDKLQSNLETIQSRITEVFERQIVD